MSSKYINITLHSCYSLLHLLFLITLFFLSTWKASTKIINYFKLNAFFTRVENKVSFYFQMRVPCPCFPYAS